jgi:uncharacterized protein (TIGR03437 family)
MTHILRLCCVVFLFVVLPFVANAQQPSIAADGVRNGASYALMGMPNAGIAQGSIFVIFGSNLGPSVLVQVSAFPLPTSQGLAGTSVKVTVGATTVDAIMLYTVASQVAAALPSNTPLGNGTVTVTYSGLTSAPAPITVVRSSFGIFALNQAGSGPGVIQNFISQASQPFNNGTTSAHPGQVMILWGTGLGPLTVGGDEANGAGFGVDMPNVNLKVWVGGREAAVQYRGRSGCCVGVDQIVFTVPAGVQGCYVSVAVQIDNVVSNYVTIAIASSGNTCSDPAGFTSAEMSQIQAFGSLCICSVNLVRSGISFSEPGLPPIDFNTDTGSTSCNCFSFDEFQRSQGICIPPAVGSCLVRTFRAGSEASDPITGTPLDAGPFINVNGPNGAKQMTPNPLLPGFYSATLSTFDPFNPFGGADYLDPGTYTIDNGGGASGTNSVGAFQVNHLLPPNLAWTNKDSITAVNREQGVQVTWTGGDPSAYVGVYGSSTNLANTAGASFVCLENATAGSFTVPPSVLLALPVSSGSLESGSFLAVGIFSPPSRFSTAGIDHGFVNSSVQTGKVLPYE